MNSRFQTIAAGLAIAAAASLAGTPAIASARPGPTDPSPAPKPAASYNYPATTSFSDSSYKTTINFTSGHPTYNINLSVKCGNQCLGDKYDIKMYQGNNVVWSATSQRARTYSVGGNVTKVVMTQQAFGGTNVGKKA